MIAARARCTPPAILRGCASRCASTSAAPSGQSAGHGSPPPSKQQKAGFNHPRTIFYGWAALVVVAGYGYYHVKSNNTAKKRDFMIKQGRSQQEQQQQLHNGELAEGQASPMPALMSTGKQEQHAQSPLQSLTAAFSRQTTQRSRAEPNRPRDQ